MSEAKRIQRQRTKGWRMPTNAVFVGRPSEWGNPFRVGAYLTAEVFTDGHRGDGGWACGMPITQQLAVDLLRAWVLARPAQVEEIRAELAGRDLVCWCPQGQPCHADVLLELANA